MTADNRREADSHEHADDPPDISRVERVPGVVGGSPVVKGTRIPVASVVIAAREYSGVDGVRDAYPRLTAEDVADALAYYLLHREDVDHHLADPSDESRVDEDERAVAVRGSTRDN